MVKRLPKHLSVSEVARHLGISRAQVRERIAAGELPGIRRGEAYIIPTGEFAQWLARQISRAVGAAP